MLRNKASQWDLMILSTPSAFNWYAEVVPHLSPGTVVVDLTGPELHPLDSLRPTPVVQVGNALIVAPCDLPSRCAQSASEAYSDNVFHLLHTYFTSLDTSQFVIDEGNADVHAMLYRGDSGGGGGGGRQVEGGVGG